MRLVLMPFRSLGPDDEIVTFAFTPVGEVPRA
jgi:hypothetical protein